MWRMFISVVCSKHARGDISLFLCVFVCLDVRNTVWKPRKRILPFPQVKHIKIKNNVVSGSSDRPSTCFKLGHMCVFVCHASCELLAHLQEVFDMLYSGCAPEPKGDMLNALVGALEANICVLTEIIDARTSHT